MTDIVERLKTTIMNPLQVSAEGAEPALYPNCAEAAAEIMRMRKVMKTIRVNCASPSVWPDPRWCRDTIVALIDGALDGKDQIEIVTFLSVVCSGGGVTDEDVATAAEIIANSHDIDAPKLPAACWMVLARDILEAVRKKQ